MKMLNDNIKPILALFVNIMGFAYFFICLFSHEKPDPQIIMAVVNLMIAVNAYYFGSSTGNSKKDETISDLARQSK